MKLFNLIASSVAVAMAAGVAQADVSQAQIANLQAQINQLQAQVSSGASNSNSLSNIVGVNSNLSWQMMDNESGVGKEMYLLQARQAGGLSAPITIGGYAQGALYYRHLNNDAKTLSGSSDSSITHLAIPNVALATTASIGDWATAYVQAGAQNIGDENITLSNESSDNLSVQDAYLVVGNLAKNPVYGFIGKKDIDFGSFATVDQYGQPINRQIFSALGNTAGVGVNAEGFNGTLSVMNGGTNGENLNTQNTNTGRNFAANVSYGMTNNGVSWNLGAGYLNGTKFATTSNTTNGTNGAWDLNGKISAYGFDLLAEYTQTTKDTYGIRPNFTTNGDLASFTLLDTGIGTSAIHANAWDVGADYNFPVMGMNSTVTAEYSTAKLASINGTNVKPEQAVIGFNFEPITNIRTGIEYAWDHVHVPAYSNSTNAKATANTILLDASAAF